MKKIFSFWRIVLQVAWAKSLRWTVTVEDETRSMLLSVNIIEYKNSKAAELIIGPLALMIGII